MVLRALVVGLCMALAAACAPVGPTQETESEPLSDAERDRLTGAYAAAIREAVTRNWLLPGDAGDVHCVVEIMQLPGGEVVDVQVAQPCDATKAVRESLRAAILRAQPLPYAGYEPVFRRTIRLDFQREPSEPR